MIFSLKPSNGGSYAASVRLLFDFCSSAICSSNGSGFLSRPKNVINSKIGTDTITSSVCWLFNPNDRRTVKHKAPTIPAPPVPELHVEIVFLLKYAEYAKKVGSLKKSNNV